MFGKKGNMENKKAISILCTWHQELTGELLTIKKEMKKALKHPQYIELKDMAEAIMMGIIALEELKGCKCDRGK